MDDRSFDRLARALGGAAGGRAGFKALASGLHGAGDPAAEAGPAADGPPAAPPATPDRSGPGLAGHATGQTSAGRRKRRRSRTPAEGEAAAAANGDVRFGIAGNGAILTNQVESYRPLGPKAIGALPVYGPSGQLLGYAPVHALATGSGPGPGPTPPLVPVATLGAACDPAINVCTSPGATCQAYTGAGAPAGAHCTLPLRAVCTGNPECRCYSCGYPTEAAPAAAQAGRDGRAAVATTCCGKAGETCGSDRDCCEGTTCSGGACVAAPCTVCKGGACAHATIAAAITAGVADIRIAGGTYEEWNLPAPTSGVPAITLRACSAAPVTIDAKQNDRIMQTIDTGRTVTFRSMTLTNAKYGSGSGGAFRVYGSLVLDRVTLSNSTADGYNAGAVYAWGGALTMTDSTISNCRATASDASGGAVWAWQGGTLTMTRSTISGCTATRFGGGIAIESNGGLSSATLTDSTVSGCSVTDNQSRGGGIYLSPRPSTAGTVALTLNGGTVVRGNTAAGPGGDGIDAERAGAPVTCANGTTAGVCGNPDAATATNATNCGGAGTFTGCAAVCAGTSTIGSGACPA